jgi:hypothetical protein
VKGCDSSDQMCVMLIGPDNRVLGTHRAWCSDEADDVDDDEVGSLRFLTTCSDRVDG